MSEQLTYLQQKVYELNKQGMSQRQIAAELHTAQPTINESLKFIRQKGYDTLNTNKQPTNNAALSLTPKATQPEKPKLYWHRYCASCGHDNQLTYGDVCAKCHTQRKRQA